MRMAGMEARLLPRPVLPCAGLDPMDRTTMQRKINYKLLLVFMGAAVVLTGGLFAVQYFQSKRIARALLWQANRAEEQSQFDRMARYLQRFLEFAPDALEER